MLVDKVDPVSAKLDLTHGRGADLVVEASGAPRAIYSSVKMLRKMGRLSQIGLTGKPDITFPWNVAGAKVISLYFIVSIGLTCWGRSLGLMASGTINVKKITTNTYPLSKWEEAFIGIENHRTVKGLIIP